MGRHRESAQVVAWVDWARLVGFPGHQTLVTLSSPKQGCVRGAARGDKGRGRVSGG